MSKRLAISSPADAGFASRLRERTKVVHRAAERAGFIADLLHGRATVQGYALFLRNLHPAYAALEPSLLAWEGHPLLGAFADPRLRRLAPLSRDLRTLAGASWAALPVLTEALAYAEAVAAAVHDPARLAAHAYARYLGDLSGGQILKPLLTRTLGLGPDALGFYDFPEIGDLAAPKLAMRAALDTLTIDGSAAEAVCDEAIAAFGHNIAVSEAVQASLATSA